MSRTVEEQTTQLSQLTRENIEHVQDLVQTRAKLDSLLGQNSKLEDAYKNAKEDCLQVGMRLDDTAQKLHEESLFVKNMITERETLASTLSDQEEELVTLKDKIATMKEKNKTLRGAKESIATENVAIKEQLAGKIQELTEKEDQLKASVKENSQLNDSLSYEMSQRLTLRRHVANLKSSLHEFRSRAHETESRLEAENECLRFDVVVLTKTLKKKKEEMIQLNKDKQLIVEYYTRDKPNSSNQAAAPNWHHTELDEMLPKSDAEKIELQNKVIQLESALYQRQQYIEELLEMVASNDTEVNQAHLSSLHGNTDEYGQSGIPKLEEDLQDIVYDQDVLGSDAIVMTTEPNLCDTIANLSSDVDVYFLKNTDHIDSQ